MRSTRRGGRVMASRLVRVLVAVIAAILWSAGPAQAHPTLLETLPRAGFGYAESPVEIGMVFDQPVTIQALTVLGQARGRVATTKPLLSPDHTKVTVRPGRSLPDGNYTVRWQITAEDGDTVDGTFSFGVGVQTQGVPGTADSSATVGLTSVATFRWLLFGGFAIALGGAVGDTVVRDRARRARKRFDVDLPIPRPWTALGSALGAVAAGLLLLNLIGQGSVIEGFRQFSLSGTSDSSAVRILLIELGGFTFALLLAAARRRSWALLGLIPVVVAEAWRSHVHGSGDWLGSITIGIHFLVAALWVGVLVHLARAAFRWRDEPRQIVAVFRRYSRFALGGYLIILATGTFAAILVLPSWGSLTGTAYGRVLLVKIGAATVATGLAIAARRGLRKPISTHRWGGLKFVRIERIVLVAVLGLTGLLTAESPVPSTTPASYPSPIEGNAVYLGQLVGQVSTGLIVGSGQVQVRLHVPETNTQDVQIYQVTGTTVHSGVPPVRLALKPCGPGCFAAPFARSSESQVILDVSAPGWTGGRANFTVPSATTDAAATIRRMLEAMKGQPGFTLNEQVTSNTARAEGMSSSLQVTGLAFIEAQPYRSGIVSGPTVLRSVDGTTEIAFALTAEDVYVQMTLDSKDRIVGESSLTPNHLITRTFSYRGH